ncbi:energy-coupling factor transporter transmembrane component T family protein [Microbacterium sp.]|uniref:energy-coupling factor transporter transmembrane component T family protein n=1 Tax=Microbacterium sp. TaxID=51671 RepID=UPI003C77E0F6
MTATTGSATSTPTAPTALDPWATDAAAGRRGRFLHGLNPLAKLAAPMPAMILLVFARDLATPLAFFAVTSLVLLAGARVTPRLTLLLFVALPLGAAVIGLSMSVWIDASRVDTSVTLVQLGGWSLYGGAVVVGMATGVRLAAIVGLALIAGLTSTGPDLVRAAVQQLRVPYRIGYTALAAFRFVPRFAYELEVIRQAHRVRGASGGRGPFAALARWWGYIVPLLAGAIRHAERVALAMDARAFGAYPDRTERHLVPWRVRDTAFVLAFWAVSAGILIAFFPWTL